MTEMQYALLKDIFLNVSFYSLSLLVYTFLYSYEYMAKPVLLQNIQYLEAFIQENKDFKEFHALMSPLLNLPYLSANKGKMLTATHREKKNSEREKEYSN